MGQQSLNHDNTTNQQQQQQQEEVVSAINHKLVINNYDNTLEEQQQNNNIIPPPTPTNSSQSIPPQQQNDNNNNSQQQQRKIKSGYMAMLAVDENYRKSGIGTELVRRVVRRMRKKGCTSVMLETEVSNKAAMRLYEDRLGFTREELLVRYYLNYGDAYRLRLW